MTLINLPHSAVEAIKDRFHTDELSLFPHILMMHSDKWGNNFISLYHLSFIFWHLIVIHHSATFQRGPDDEELKAIINFHH